MKKMYTDELLKKYGQKALEAKLSELWNEVESANKEALTEMMLYMNRYTVASIAGKIRVIDKIDPAIVQWDYQNAMLYFQIYRYKKLKLCGLRENKHGKLTGIIEDSQVEIFPQWFSNETRYDGLVMKPNQPYGLLEKRGYGYFNTWKGWKVKPSEEGCCDLLTDCIHDDICAGNDLAYQYLIDYLADMIQHPEIKNPKIIVINGKQGTFKTTVMDVMTHIMGEQYAVTMSNHMLTSHFNAPLFGKIMAIADESVWAGNRDQWGQLKALTGNITIPIEGKGKDAFIADNFIHLFVTTNEDYSFPNEQGNRRSVYYPTSDDHLNDSVYRDAIYEELRDGGYERFMWELMNRKINANFFGDCPVFSAKVFEETRLESLSSENPIAKWLYESFMGICTHKANVFYGHMDGNGEEIWKDNVEVRSSAMFSRYCTWAEEAHEPKNVVSTMFGRKLAQICDSRHGKEGTVYMIDKAKMKQRLEKITGFKIHDEVTE